MTNVFLTLGAAIVKAALRVWARGQMLGADADVSIVEIIRANISDDLDRRKAQRFLEDLEVPVANRLQSLYINEFKAMAESEWYASVLAANFSFDRADLTARNLLAHDLDPLSLEQLIRANNPSATHDLSAEGITFYDRIISEGCAYIIEIADKLPAFQAEAFAELLHRERKILERISEVLDRIPQRASGEEDESRFVTAYLRHITTRLDRLEIFGLDFESPWYPLSIAYVSLQASEPKSTQAQNIEEILAASRRALVLGRAGAGKSAVLQWLAVRAARSDFTGKMAELNGYIPFYIRLREYVNKGLPAPEDFIANIAPMLSPLMPSGWIRARLSSGRSLVLVDGVDELPDRQRELASSWLEDLVHLFPNARYVVTGRSEAVRQRWLADCGFMQVSLEAMSPSLTRAFIKNWHAAVSHAQADNEERERLNEYGQSLLISISDDRYLRDLADTPILAGLLCALNRHLRSQLPRRRSDIYERAMIMFDQRDRARLIDIRNAALDMGSKRHLLAELAFWMVRNGVSEVDQDTVQALMRRSLAAFPQTELTADDVFRVLLEHSGVLREPAAHRVDFIHRTFQEYLAARAAIDGDAIGELVRNADDVQWRELILLAAGQANQAQAFRLLQGLLGPTNQGSRRRRRTLAISCLREVRALDPALRQDVMSLLPSLLPPQSMDQAEELSAAGPRLIRPLSQQWARDIAKAPETIRAASLVGGPAALDLIESVISGYPEHNISMLVPEVSRAWQYFNHDDYAHRIVAPLKLRDLSISYPRMY